MEVPRISVIMPVRNKLAYTQACLQALRRVAPFDPPYELTIVDDGSSDDTPSYLRSLGGRVRVCRNAISRGFAAACNLGATQAGGEFLVFLNNDTIPHPGWLSALLEPMRADSSIGVVGSKLLYPDGSIQHAGVVFAPAAYSPIMPLHIYKGDRGDAPWVNKPREFQAVTAACLLVRRDLFLGLGGFDKAYVNEFEDVDFCFRVRERGLRVFYTPKSVLTHHEMVSRGHSHGEANLVLLTRRWSARISPDYRQYLAEDERSSWKLTALGAGAHYDLGQVADGDAEFVRVLHEVPTGYLAIFKEFRCYWDLDRMEPMLSAAVGRVLSSPEAPPWAGKRRKAFQAELHLTLAKMYFMAGRTKVARDHLVQALSKRPSLSLGILWLLVRTLRYARLRVLWGRGLRGWLQHAQN